MLVDDFVLCVDFQHLRLVIGKFAFVDIGVSEYDNNVADHSGSCSGAVQEHYAGICRTFDCVGYQSRPIIEIQNVNLLARQNVCCSKKIRVNRNTPLIMQIGRGQRCPMYLRFQHDSLHGLYLQLHCSVSKIPSQAVIIKPIPISTTNPGLSYEAIAFDAGFLYNGHLVFFALCLYLTFTSKKP